MNIAIHFKPLRGFVLAGFLALVGFYAAADSFPFMPAPGPNTTNIDVTGAAATLTLPTNFVGLSRSMLFMVIGSQNVFLLCDGTATAAPTTATVSNAQPAQPGGFLMTLPSSTTSCSVIASGAGSKIYATVGFGI